MTTDELLQIFKFEKTSDEIRTVLSDDVLSDAIENLLIDKSTLIGTLEYLTNHSVDAEYLKAWGLTFAHIFYIKYEREVEVSDGELYSSGEIEYLIFNGSWNGEVFYVLQSIRSAVEMIAYYGAEVAIDVYKKLIDDINVFDINSPNLIRLEFNNIRCMLLGAMLKNPALDVAEINAKYPEIVQMIREFESM